MWIRRSLFYWQFAAALVLPVWVLIGRGIFGSSLGWDFLLFAFLCPVLGIAMIVIAGLTAARKAVRTSRAVSWLDAAVLVVWHGAIIAFGFIDTTAIAVLVVVAAIAAFWIAVGQLVVETRNRVRSVMASFEEAARADRPAHHTTSPIDDPNVFLIQPHETGRTP
jgi:hypothetical protein